MLGDWAVKRQSSYQGNGCWLGRGTKCYALNDDRCIRQLVHENDSYDVDSRSHNAETTSIHVKFTMQAVRVRIGTWPRLQQSGCHKRLPRKRNNEDKWNCPDLMQMGTNVCHVSAPFPAIALALNPNAKQLPRVGQRDFYFSYFVVRGWRL